LLLSLCLIPLIDTKQLASEAAWTELVVVPARLDPELPAVIPKSTLAL